MNPWLAMLNLGALYTLFCRQKLNKVLTKTHDEIQFYERNVGPINFDELIINLLVNLLVRVKQTQNNYRQK